MKVISRSLQKPSIFKMDGYCVWDPSMVQDENGKYHLFFSRWPTTEGFEGWLTHSQVCRATAETPLGPYRFAEVVLPGKCGSWDAKVTHNPSVKRFGSTYYLYYTGNNGCGNRNNYRNSQRIGLATATNIAGPWKRNDCRPVLDISTGAWDSDFTTNPSCSRTPDGRYILLYKGGRNRHTTPDSDSASTIVAHGAAFADSPDGPFVKNPEPLFVTGDAFPGEDPFVWCEHQFYYVLLKDMGTFYTSTENAIVLFQSENGINWSLADDPVVKDRWIEYDNGVREKVSRLERPFLYHSSDGLFFFCSIKPHRNEDFSFIAAMEL